MVKPMRRGRAIREPATTTSRMAPVTNFPTAPVTPLAAGTDDVGLLAPEPTGDDVPPGAAVVSLVGPFPIAAVAPGTVATADSGPLAVPFCGLEVLPEPADVEPPGPVLPAGAATMSLAISAVA
jgi:hypothetical protein